MLLFSKANIAFVQNPELCSCQVLAAPSPASAIPSTKLGHMKPKALLSS
jgi:hypothetical protein